MKQTRLMRTLVTMVVLTWILSLLFTGEYAWAVGSQSSERQTIPVTGFPTRTRTPARVPPSATSTPENPAPAETNTRPPSAQSTVTSTPSTTIAGTPVLDTRTPSATPTLSQLSTGQPSPAQGMTSTPVGSVAVPQLATPMPKASRLAQTSSSIENQPNTASDARTPELLSGNGISLVSIGCSLGVGFVALGIILSLLQRRAKRL